MRKQLAFNGKKYSATMHYITNYGYIPMQVLVKLLSFGVILEFFTILKREDKEEISKLYKMKSKDILF